MYPETVYNLFEIGLIIPSGYTGFASKFVKEGLKTFRKLGSRLQGHVHISIPGVELSTDSLGQGLSVANGVALGAKMRKVDFNIYCLLGDGEIRYGRQQ